MASVKVEAAFGSTMFSTSPSWTDVSDYVRPGVASRRGRPSAVGRFTTGTASVLLDNRDGRFNPDNTAGTHYPDVTIGTPIRITVEDGTSTSYPVFYGSAREWSPDYPKSGDSTVLVPLADGFYDLNLEDLGQASFPAQRTDQRITAVLDEVGWPAAQRDLDEGVATVQAVDFAQPGDGGPQPALNHLLDVAESEVGTLFMSADGKVTFRNRVAMSGASPAVTFTSAEMSGLTVAYNDDYWWNVIQVAREDGLQVEYDASSGAPRRVLTRDVMPMGNDAEALNVAQWLAAMFGTQRLRVSSLVLKPLGAAGVGDVFGLELRSMVTVQHTPPGGDALNQACSVEEIHQAFRKGEWVTTLSVAPLATVESQSYWILGTSELGVSTRLA